MSNTTLSLEKKIVVPEIIKTEIVISHQELEQEKEKYLKQIQKNIELPGFRPGKAPFTLIKKKYNNTAFYEGFEHLLKKKTNDVLKSQLQKPLYYAYNFEASDIIEDNGSDKKIYIEILLEPQVDVDLKNTEVEFVKYAFTEGQKKILADIIILFNFLKNNPTENIDISNEEFFIITAELELPSNSEIENEQKKKDIKITLVLHPLRYQSYGLKELLPNTLQNKSTYTIDIDQWITILKKNFQDKKMAILDFLKKGKESNISSVNITIHDIQHYNEFSPYLNKDGIKAYLGLENENDINIDVVYSKLSEVADIVADYFSGEENINRCNAFIYNLIQVELPDDFVFKLYNNFVRENDHQHITFDHFKKEINKQIQNNILKNILPNTFDTSVQLEEFATNVAKYYVAKGLLTELLILELNAIKNHVLHSLQSSDNENKEKLLQNHSDKDAVFSLPKYFSQDVKTISKLENINATSFSHIFGIKKELFV